MIGIFHGSLQNHICIVSLNDHTICAFDPAIYLYKARIRVRATTPAIPQIARRSYRSRTRRVRRRTSVLSISPRVDALGEGTKAQRAMRILSTEEGHASSFVSYIIRDLQVRARLSSHG